jgi:hypothetical protein
MRKSLMDKNEDIIASFGLMKLNEIIIGFRWVVFFFPWIFQVFSLFKLDYCVSQISCNQFVLFSCHRFLKWCSEQGCHFTAQTLGNTCDGIYKFVRFQTLFGPSLLCHFPLELAWSLEFNKVGGDILDVLGPKLGQFFGVLKWEVGGHK